jgi:predicted nucleotidyltransferase
VTSLAPEAVARVDAVLAEIRRAHGVHVPLVIESGSRAWGFPSPDSDYDCRFIFVRPVEQHVALWPPRDVIETPLQGELDVNGWELGKALRLMLKGNAIVIEWLQSPIVYAGDPLFRDELLAFAHKSADPAKIRSHYLHLGARQRAVYFETDAPVSLKKIFYVLRPAAALRWMRLHPGQAIAPMHFPTLVEEGDWPDHSRELVADLLGRKAVTREMGRGPMPRPLDEFIDSEFRIAREALTGGERGRNAEASEEADLLFKQITWHLEAAGRFRDG